MKISLVTVSFALGLGLSGAYVKMPMTAPV